LFHYYVCMYHVFIYFFMYLFIKKNPSIQMYHAFRKIKLLFSQNVHFAICTTYLSQQSVFKSIVIGLRYLVVHIRRNILYILYIVIFKNLYLFSADQWSEGKCTHNNKVYVDCKWETRNKINNSNTVGNLIFLFKSCIFWFNSSRSTRYLVSLVYSGWTWQLLSQCIVSLKMYY